ncbi:MAG: hypothetical protein P1P86_05580 [Bacteroidales bacterium]|nr:hypothetical protein [Bacteroidales bacterium]
MKPVPIPGKISLLLNDRESGSIALLKRLIAALEEEMHGPDLNAEAFGNLLLHIREKLNHFAAIDNFLASLILHAGQKDAFPGETLRYIKDYRLYWQDSAGKIAENFLRQCNPVGLTLLTHSHSETVISLLKKLHVRQIPFRVLQTLSSPGEEGKISHERMLRMKLRADLIDEANITEAVGQSDLVLMACDALLYNEFLNKTGTRAILEQARILRKRSFLVTESRKKITRPDWQQEWTEQALFEWVPLNLIDGIVTETGFSAYSAGGMRTG